MKSRTLAYTLCLVGALWLGVPERAVADEADDPKPVPDTGADEQPKPTPDTPPTADAPPPTDARPLVPPGFTNPQPVQTLPQVDIRAPRIYNAPGSSADPFSVTALRRRTRAFDVPASVTILEGRNLTGRRMIRSTPDSFLNVPGVLVQKTAPLQSSPFIRGFTSYNNLFLIDGIRLNNSAFRAGPNQYWSTVDGYTIESLELARGPHSVLYGSDAVGGTVNAIPWRRRSFNPGTHVGGGMRLRAASGEQAIASRVLTQGNINNFGWYGGATFREYGNIISGAGELPNTGGITERDADFRVDHHINRSWTLTAAFQHVRQFDAPRTERTIFSVPFEGTAVGNELRRDFNQERDLVYARASYNSCNKCSAVTKGFLTVSWHRQKERRDRLRTMVREDINGFVVHQLGVQAQLESPTPIGYLTYGVDYYNDDIDTFQHNWVGGAPTGSNIQGPLGDNGSYHLFGAYVQDQLDYGPWDIVAGVRFTFAAAHAGRVDNPAVPGSDPTTPGNVISVTRDFTNVVGSLRVLRHINKCWNVYGAVSQSFRAPSLHDLTSLDSTSVVESPSPNLDAEKFVTGEVGVKTESRNFFGEAAVWLTRLDDVIIRSPTGALIMGTPEVRKDNIGDGWAWGFEVEAAKRFQRCWIAYANVSWMDSDVKEFDAASGTLVDSVLTRMLPANAMAGLRYEPPWSRVWAETDVRWFGRADRLSLRDQADSRRIPPGGTPMWATWNLRAGVNLTPKQRISAALENITDTNYRIHGSGQNEVGRQLVFAYEADI